jgi:hypothetical protein
LCQLSLHVPMFKREFQLDSSLQHNARNLNNVLEASASKPENCTRKFESAGFTQKHCPGSAASPPRSEVVPLVVFRQWARFPGERIFYRYALALLRSAFPTLPNREHFNRLQYSSRESIAVFTSLLIEQQTQGQQ